jgi:hypothetical protein
MDINELESYRLQDAIKFNKKLNPRLWGSDEHLLPEVRDKLLEIAEDFREFLGIDVDVQDITISGSNAAYTYTPHSDIDLHLVVDLPRADSDEVYRELFDAKKYQYNDRNDFKIGGADVELYVQDPSKPHHSQGIYSVKHNKWIDVPKRRKPAVDDVSVRSKYEDLGARIENAIRSGDLSEMDRMADKIRELRQAGLDQTGEFGPENLAFKILRNNGTLEQLSQARKTARDQIMSLAERKKKKSKKRTKYAYGGYWYPGYHYYGDTAAATDGGSDGGGESVKESQEQSQQDILERFARSCCDFLGMEKTPVIKLRRDPQWSRVNATFGRYDPDQHRIELATSGRHIVDILRTLAHEMTHARQDEVVGLPDDAGETGSTYEDQANALAGQIMRHWAQQEPGMFAGADLDEGLRGRLGAVAAAACIAGTPGCATTDALKTVQTIGRTAQTLKGMKGSDAREELTTAAKDALRKGTGTRESQVREASGYIPTAAEKNDPRYSMALTVDVKPGETGRQANKLALDTDAQGRPALLMKKLNNLLESVKAGEDTLTEDQDLFEVKMSPGELQKWAQSEEAQGIRAGFEAELIFRNTARDEQEESEPDYEYDSPTQDIDNVIDFFQGGEGIGRNAANRLRDSLYEEFYQWQTEQVDKAWDGDEEDQVRDWMENNVWEEDQDEYRTRAAEELEIETSEESADQSEAIEKRAREMFEEDVQSSIASRDEEWQEAYDYFSDMMRDSEDLDQSEWLRDQYRYMSDIANSFEVDWPYWTEGNYGEGRDVDEIADSLSRALGGAKVRGSTGYHSVSRRPDLWIVEPDGSLDPDDYEDAGLEVVSPPMPLPDAMAALKKVIDWANGSGDAYTNDSTGLHMGVSLPFKGGDVDYVKLVLFLGDQYVLDEFGRAANSYTRSALEKLRDVQRSRRPWVKEQEGQSMDSMRGADKTAAAMDLMKKNLIELAARYVQDGVGKSKYTSAHIKDGYIEFRSPGGDYLSMDSRDENALTNTMLRFARAMQIAGRPDLERQEYSKKLYKLLTGYRAAETKKPEKGTRYRTNVETEDSQDALELFAKYSTGQITPEELKKQWAREVLAKEQPKQVPGQKYEIYNKDTGEVLDVVSGENEADLSLAIGDAVGKYSAQGINYDIRKQSDEPEKKISRRAQVAKKIAERPTLWRVSAFDRRVFVMAATAEQAKAQAIEQDDQLSRSRSYVEARPATPEEIKQHREQAADNAQDIEQIQQRVTGQRWFKVFWTEQRGNANLRDSLRTQASSEEAAIRSVQQALEVQGRRATDFSAMPSDQDREYETYRRDDGTAGLRPVQAATGSRREYQIYSRATNNPVIGFMADSDEEAMQRLERYRLEHPGFEVGVRTGGESMRTQTTPQSEWTGQWIVKDAEGRELTRFHGIGNNQQDANRHAIQWLTRNGYGSGTEVEVVPEMR